MRYFRHSSTIAVTLLAWAVVCASQSQAENIDLQGSWKVVSYVRDGAIVPFHGGYRSILIYEDRIIFDNQRAEARTLSYRVHSKKLPMQLDILDEQGEQKLFSAIFKLDQDTLQLCMGELRPTEFQTGKDDGRELFLLKRSPQP